MQVRKYQKYQKCQKYQNCHKCQKYQKCQKHSDIRGATSISDAFIKTPPPLPQALHPAYKYQLSTVGNGIENYKLVHFNKSKPLPIVGCAEDLFHNISLVLVKPFFIFVS